MPDLSGEGAQGDLHCPAIADDPGLAVAAVQSELAQKRSAPDATRSMPVSFHGLHVNIVQIMSRLCFIVLWPVKLFEAF